MLTDSNILEMKGIMKVYPNGVVANSGVDFSVKKGEIHALLGENGAGKSTLMKILFGIESPQEGDIYLKGQKVHFHSSKDAIKRGIGMVHQHFMLVPSLSIAENIVLGDEIVKNKFFIDNKRTNKDIKDLAKKYNFDLDIKAKIQDVKVVIKQKVEILKALYRGAKVLILDEPTAILTPQETQELFKQLKILRDNGHTIIFITHKLDEVKAICDRLSILNHGKSMGTYDVKDLTKKEIAKLMVGREIKEKFNRPQNSKGEKVLEVKDIVLNNPFGKPIVDGISFELFSGEILSIVGVEGNGQSELIQSINGLKKISKGKILFKGNDIHDLSVEKIRELGVAHIPEDRMTTGIAANMSIEENLLTNRIALSAFQNKGFLNFENIGKEANELISKYEIKCSNKDQKVKMLSGGNIQKVVVARELANSPELIIANHPTRGIDIGSAEFIRQELINRKGDGAAILLVTADFEECFQISDRILVMYKGQITGVFENNESINEMILGEYMLGVKKQKMEVDYEH